MDEVCMLEAHDSEVLCLEFTEPENGTITFLTNFSTFCVC